jgi:hypothetical protein
VDLRVSNRVHASVICAVLAVASLSLGCGSNPAQPSNLPLGQSFDLRSGSSAALQDGLRVTFTGVPSDSRCPMDAMCIWAGDAIAKVSLSQSGGSPADLDLHTGAGGSQASYLGYVITLTVLAPYPRSDRPIRPQDYVATLVVDSR